MLRGRWSAALAAAIFMAAAGNASAATIVVNTTSGNSPAGDGLCSLSEAITDVDAPGASSGDCAPAAFGANTITLGPHTYPLGAPAAGQASALSIASAVIGLHITGAGESSTVIDASGSGTRALEIAAGASVTISDLTVTGGHALDGAAGSPAPAGETGGNGGPGADGGAILNGGALTLTDVAVTNSVAGTGGPGGRGGPVDSGGGSGSPTASWGGVGGDGGSGGAIFNSATLTLQGATLSGDQAGSGGPGGMGGSAASGTGAVGGAGGSGGSGGALENAGGNLVVTASTINGNRAGTGGDGGLYGGGTFTGPGASGGDGGGIGTVNGALSVTNSTLASNDAGNAGSGGNPGPVVAPGPPPVGAGGSGGALAVSTATATLHNDTIAGNGAGAAGTPGGSPGAAGGVIVTAGTTPGMLRDTLLYLNDGGDCFGAIADGGHNLSFGAGGCPGSFIGGNPNLGPLQDNGGPTKTISLQPGSAAIDAGTGCPATDQRGVPRPATTACDVGAYEVAAPTGQTEGPSSVSAHGATLVAQVTPNSGDASVSFVFGRGRKYGAQTKPQQLDGVTATPISAKLGRLRDHTTYHYRVRVTSMDGTTVGADRTFTTSDDPALRSLRLEPARFNVAGTATMISYTDNLTARTRFTVLRAKAGVRQGKRCVARTGHSGHGGSCTRYVRVGGFSHSDVVGTNKVSFSGRLGSHKLAPGRYELRAVPRAGKHSGTARTVKFTVIG